MHDVVDLFEQIRARSSAENDRLAAAFRLASGDPRISALNIIHQQATISAELLSHYMGWEPSSRSHASRGGAVATRKCSASHKPFKSCVHLEHFGS